MEEWEKRCWQQKNVGTIPRYKKEEEKKKNEENQPSTSNRNWYSTHRYNRIRLNQTDHRRMRVSE